MVNEEAATRVPGKMTKFCAGSDRIGKKVKLAIEVDREIAAN